MAYDGELTITTEDGCRRLGTRQCAHCGCHWIVRPGSKTIRGFCMCCNGFVCGPLCAGKCIPTEQLLENIEQRRPLDYRPIRVNVPSLWTP